MALSNHSLGVSTRSEPGRLLSVFLHRLPPPVRLPLLLRVRRVHPDDERLFLRLGDGQAVGAARHRVPDVEPAAGRLADVRPDRLRPRRDEEDGRELDPRRLRLAAHRGGGRQHLELDELRLSSCQACEKRGHPHLRAGRLPVAAELVPGRVVHDASAGIGLRAASMHTNRWQSDIINYEHPAARAQYSESSCTPSATATRTARRSRAGSWATSTATSACGA